MIKLPPIYDNEKGMVLSVALMVLAILTLMGSAAIVSTRTGVKIAGNWKNQTKVFYLAEAGVDYAKNALSGDVDLDGDSVVDKTQVFNDNQTVTWDSTAVLANLQMGASGNVTIVRDPTDPLLAMITSEAAYGGTRTVIKVAVKRNFVLPQLPGAVVQISNGWNDFDVDGTVSGFDESSTCPDVAGHVHRGQTVIIEGSTVVGNPAARDYDSDIDDQIWDDPDQVVAMIEGWMNDPNAVTITANTPPAILGTAANPQITVWDPTATSSNQSASFTGYGILIIKGRFNLKSSFDFHGLIVAYGGSEMAIEGSNSQVVHGAVLAADNAPLSGSEDTEVGILNNTEVNYNCHALATYVQPLIGGGSAVSTLSWRQDL